VFQSLNGLKLIGKIKFCRFNAALYFLFVPDPRIDFADNFRIVALMVIVTWVTPRSAIVSMYGKILSPLDDRQNILSGIVFYQTHCFNGFLGVCKWIARACNVYNRNIIDMLMQFAKYATA
jgi:hypothetical protein